LKNYPQVVTLKDFVTLGPELLVSIMKVQQSPDLLQNNTLLPIPDATLVEDLTSLYRDMDFTDFTLVVDKEEMSTHMCLLAARCQYFSATFRSNMKEMESRKLQITVADFIPTVSSFESFLNFLYTDSVQMPVQNAVYVIPMTEFYGLSNKKLQLHCVKNIEYNFSPQNLLACLEAADHCNLITLKQQFLHEIVKSYVEVMESEYLVSLDRPLLIDIMRMVALDQKKKQLMEQRKQDKKD